jgi:hypothetical protein
MRRSLSLLGALVVVASLVACGKGDIGEDCSEDGKSGGQCVADAVCGHKDSIKDGSLVCLKQCRSIADCGKGEVCGATGSPNLSGCRAQ